MNTVKPQSKDSLLIHKATAPLFRDPIYDGAADPVMVYNKEKKEWRMFYSKYTLKERWTMMVVIRIPISGL